MRTNERRNENENANERRNENERTRIRTNVETRTNQQTTNGAGPTFEKRFAGDHRVGRKVEGGRGRAGEGVTSFANSLIGIRS